MMSKISLTTLFKKSNEAAITMPHQGHKDTDGHHISQEAIAKYMAQIMALLEQALEGKSVGMIGSSQLDQADSIIPADFFGILEKITVLQAENEHLAAMQKDQETANIDQRYTDLQHDYDNQRDLLDGFSLRVTPALNTLRGSAKHLEGTANGLKAASQQSMDDASQTIRVSSDSAIQAESLANSAEQMHETTEMVSDNVAQVLKHTNQTVEKMQETGEVVQELEKVSDNIVNVVNLIKDIAAKTNLLALNATIEAARAGEAGRGFAVVASEVKALAEQTAKATDIIGQEVDQIRSVSSQSVEQIKDMEQSIQSVRQSSENMHAVIEAQQQETAKISENALSSSQAVVEVTELVGEISTNIQGIGVIASHMLEAAKELDQLANHVSAEVDRVQV